MLLVKNNNMLLVNFSILTVFLLGEEQGGEKELKGEKRIKLVKQEKQEKKGEKKERGGDGSSKTKNKVSPRKDKEKSILI